MLYFLSCPLKKYSKRHSIVVSDSYVYKLVWGPLECPTGMRRATSCSKIQQESKIVCPEPSTHTWTTCGHGGGNSLDPDFKISSKGMCLVAVRNGNSNSYTYVCEKGNPNLNTNNEIPLKIK